MKKIDTPARKTLARSIAAALVFTAAAASPTFALVNSALAADQQATTAQMDNETNYIEAGTAAHRWSGAYNSTAPAVHRGQSR